MRFDASKRTNVTIPDLKGFKTVFLDVDKGEELHTLLYDQRITYDDIPLAILNEENHIAHESRNANGLNYINGIVDDVINKLSTVDPFTIDLMSITKLEIGGGKVKIGIPLSDKAISLDEKDLLSFKEGVSNIV